jgi:hypothetical protein
MFSKDYLLQNKRNNQEKKITSISHLQSLRKKELEVLESGN